MEISRIQWIIDNNTVVDFIRKIKKKVFNGKLVVSKYKGDYIVCPFPIERALKKNDYIIMDSQEEANLFVNNYKDYYKETSPDEMTQKQFEEWRTSKAAQFRFAGQVKGGRFLGTIEKIS